MTSPAAVVQDMAAMREENRAQADAPMSIGEAVDLARRLRQAPETVLDAARSKRAIDALLSGLEYSPTYLKAIVAGEEVFVLRQRDRCAPAAIVTWTRSASEHGCPDEKVLGANGTWRRWYALPESMTRWPD